MCFDVCECKQTFHRLLLPSRTRKTGEIRSNLHRRRGQRVYEILSGLIFQHTPDLQVTNGKIRIRGSEAKKIGSYPSRLQYLEKLQAELKYFHVDKNRFYECTRAAGHEFMLSHQQSEATRRRRGGINKSGTECEKKESQASRGEV